MEATGGQFSTGKRTVVKAEYGRDIAVKTEVDTKDCWITGSDVLSGDRLALIDRNNECIKLVNVSQGQGHVITQMKLVSYPSFLWDVANIDGNHVAVTLPYEEKVAIVSVVPGLSLDRKIFVGGWCHGVDYRDGKLALALSRPEMVKVLDLQGTVLYNISDPQDTSVFNCGCPHYVTFGVDSTVLYVSNYTSHTLVCVKLDGTVMETYTDFGFVYPQSAIVDSCGSVYVCFEGTNSIHQLTKDLRRTRVLLSQDDGLSKPQTACFSETEEELFVGMYNTNIVKVFKTVYGTE